MRSKMAQINKSFSEIIGELPKYIIVDLDVGTDDAWALLMLLAAEAHKDFKIIAVTCVQGNTNVDNVSTNVLRVLESVDRIDLAVYRGAEKPLIPPPFSETSHLNQYHGQDGFGDVNFSSTPDCSIMQSENAVSAINRITSSSEYQGKVSMVCLGPLTNIGLAMRTYPEFGKNIKSIFMMGGNSTGRGNVTSTAEFNFHSDPEAAHIVLSSSVCPITIMPWETCLEAPLSLEWRFNVLGVKQNKKMALMNLIEHSVFDRLKCSVMLCCDQMLTAAILCPSMVTKYSHVHMTVELHGYHTRGQAVIDHLFVHNPNVILIQKVDVEMFKEMMLLAAGN